MSPKELLNLAIPRLSRFDSNDSAIDSGDFDDHQNIIDGTPRLEHYLKTFDFNHIERPTVRQLHQNPVFSIDVPINVENGPKVEKQESFIEVDEKDKFGYFTMVYIPQFMNLLGTAFYIQSSIMAAQSGLILALLQIAIGTTILIGTILSISALVTNGHLGCGGLYYLISRNLGPEIGAVFGIIYFLTNAIMVSLSISGNSIIILNILQNLNTNILPNGSDLDNQRIIGIISLVIVAAIPFISLDFEAKTQWVLFGIVMLSVLDFIVGSFLRPTAYQMVAGFVGWSGRGLKTNLLPQWNGYTFFATFSVYLSGLCGDFTGVTMASSVKNPKVSIPKGSILGIITTQLVYIIQMIWFTSTTNRYATGNLSDYPYNNYTCTLAQNCPGGSSNNPYMMSVISAFTRLTDKTHHIEPLYSAGLLSQSLSSAMIAFISAPRILQSLGFDELLPLIKWFSKPYGKHADPRRGYILTFMVSIIFVGISEFNILATITSNCYLCAWGLVNITCFHCDYVKGSNWRPLFRFYNKWFSLVIGLLCFGLMFAIQWYIALAIIGIMAIIYVFKLFYKTDVNWGQTPDTQLYKTTVAFAHKLVHLPEHAKTFRPSVLLLSGSPMHNQDLVSMANQITRHRGMLIVGDIVCTNIAYDYKHKTHDVWNKWFKDNKVKCFYKLITAKTLGDGSNMLIQCCGFGNNLSPNIVMIGFRDSWTQCTQNDINDYFNIFHSVFEMQKSLIIYRNYKISKNYLEKQKLKLKKSLTDNQPKIINFDGIKEVTKLTFIDIYWLYDDGGLTLLVPYILSQRKVWQKCKLRIFVVIDKESDSHVTEKNASDLLNKFRIEFYDIIVLNIPSSSYYHRAQDIAQHIRDDNLYQFRDPNSKVELYNALNMNQSKTNKFFSLRELLEKYSINSQLIVMTMEIPQKGTSNALLFMYWLDMLSQEMPPFLYIRGNQTNVLTFHLD